MGNDSTRSPPDTDPASALIAEWRQRLPAFERGRRRFAGDIRQDRATVWVREHLIVGSRLTFDAALQGMLTLAERQRLETDPQFTRAWRIFVDLCWMKKQCARAGLAAALILVGILLVGLLLLGLPEAIGPQGR